MEFNDRAQIHGRQVQTVRLLFPLMSSRLKVSKDPYAFRIILFILFIATSAYPLQAENDYANHFKIEDFGTHRLIHLYNPLHQDHPERQYALVPRGKALPKLPPDLPVIRTPVRRVIALETVPIGYLEALGALDCLIGAGSVQYIASPLVRERIDQGIIKPVANGSALDSENILLLQPDLVLLSADSNAGLGLPEPLLRAGLPIVPTAGYMEPHPLGRAEWLRVFAAFLEKENEAETLFRNLVTNYERLRQKMLLMSFRPTVFCQTPYSGIWHMPGGNSHTARLIHDAGGHYLWAEDTGHTGIPLDPESVFLRAAKADYWINPGTHRSLNSIIGADPRFSHFKAFKEKRVFNNTRMCRAGVGNPIHEQALVRTDDVLADLIHILHPQQLPDHQPVFYEQLH